MKYLSTLVLMLFFTNAANAFVLAGTTPGKWGSSIFGTGATITWSLAGTGVGCTSDLGCTTLTSLDDFMPIGYEAQLVRAFDAWSAVADVTFVKVADGGEDFNAPGSSGDIRVAGHPITASGGLSGLESLGAGTLAHGFFRQ